MLPVIRASRRRERGEAAERGRGGGGGRREEEDLERREEVHTSCPGRLQALQWVHIHIVERKKHVSGSSETARLDALLAMHVSSLESRSAGDRLTDTTK